MKIKYLVFLIPIITYSQRSYEFKNKIAIGINIIDDSFTSTYNPLNLDALNANFSPSYFSYERGLNENYFISLNITFNNFDKGKLIDGYINNQNLNHFSIDINNKYYLYNFINDKIFSINENIEPYLNIGIGYTNIDNFQQYPFISYGFGTNLWFGIFEDNSCNCKTTNRFFSNFGLFFQVIAKSSLQENITYNGNEIQYSTGLIYRF